MLPLPVDGSDAKQHSGLGGHTDTVPSSCVHQGTTVDKLSEELDLLVCKQRKPYYATTHSIPAIWAPESATHTNPLPVCIGENRKTTTAIPQVLHQGRIGVPLVRGKCTATPRTEVELGPVAFLHSFLLLSAPGTQSHLHPLLTQPFHSQFPPFPALAPCRHLSRKSQAP